MGLGYFGGKEAYKQFKANHDALKRIFRRNQSADEYMAGLGDSKGKGYKSWMNKQIDFERIGCTILALTFAGIILCYSLVVIYELIVYYLF